MKTLREIHREILLKRIERKDRAKIFNKAQVETPSVSDNETKKKLCRVFDKCDMALKCEKNCSEFSYLMKCYEE